MLLTAILLTTSLHCLRAHMLMLVCMYVFFVSATDGQEGVILDHSLIMLSQDAIEHEPVTVQCSFTLRPRDRAYTLTWRRDGDVTLRHGTRVRIQHEVSVTSGDGDDDGEGEERHVSTLTFDPVYASDSGWSIPQIQM